MSSDDINDIQLDIDDNNNKNNETLSSNNDENITSESNNTIIESDINKSKEENIQDINIKEESIEKSDKYSAEDRKTIDWLFKFLFCLNILIMVDSGGIPSSLGSIEIEMNLSFTQLGALGSLVYIGLTSSSLFAGAWLQEYNERNLLIGSIIINGLFCFLFGLSESTFLLLLCRFITGICQSFLVIFAPCWVDEYAPRGSQTLWMALLQLSNPLGIMFGYVCGIIAAEEIPEDTSNFTIKYGNWRYIFIIQGIIIMVTAATMYFIDSKYFQITNNPTVEDYDSFYDSDSDLDDENTMKTIIRGSLLMPHKKHRHSSIFLQELISKPVTTLSKPMAAFAPNIGVTRRNAFFLVIKNVIVLLFSNVFVSRL